MLSWGVFAAAHQVISGPIPVSLVDTYRPATEGASSGVPNNPEFRVCVSGNASPFQEHPFLEALEKSGGLDDPHFDDAVGRKDLRVDHRGARNEHEDRRRDLVSGKKMAPRIASPRRTKSALHYQSVRAQKDGPSLAAMKVLADQYPIPVIAKFLRS